MINFSIADKFDDDALRERMREDLLEGEITVSFRRDPSFFYGSSVQGDMAQVIKCTDKNDSLVGLGSRVLLDTYINGKDTRTGYLSDLRLKLEYRGGTILKRAYEFLYRCHVTEPVSLYYSMILEKNIKALRALTKSRCNLPHYQDIGRFLTPAIFLDLPKPDISLPGVTCCRANEDDMNNVFEFIEQNASNKQFAPVISASDLHTARLRGLSANDFYIAYKDNEIIGVVAAWDQSEFRQTYIEKYNFALRALRTLYNILSRATCFKTLPSPGEKVPYFYLAFTHIKHNRPDIFRLLLRYLYNDRRKGNWNYFIAGLHENDPLSSILEEYRRIKVSGRLFVVHYPENKCDFNNLDNRIPYVEISMI